VSAIAFIPARGGSKGILLKNLAQIYDKPLIDWTIEAAQNTELIDRIIVSTDHNFIASHAFRFDGVEIHKRPEELSGDQAQIEDAMKDAFGLLNIHPTDEIVLLQPTSPIRRPWDIEMAIETFRRGEFDSLFSATPIFPYVWLPPMEGAHTDLDPLRRAFHAHTLPRLNRQDRRPPLQESGSIYITKASWLSEHKNRLCGRVGYYRMPSWTSIEIDDWYDVAIANTTMQYHEEVLT